MIIKHEVVIKAHKENVKYNSEFSNSNHKSLNNSLVKSKYK